MIRLINILLFSYCISCFNICEFDKITFISKDTTAIWKNCSPSSDLTLNSKKDAQKYFIDIVDVEEITPEGDVIITLNNLINLFSNPYGGGGYGYNPYGGGGGYKNFTDNEDNFTIYDINITDIFNEKNQQVGRQLNFSVPFAYSLVYSLYNTTKHIRYGGKEFDLEAGVLKLETYLTFWPFVSPLNSLNFFFKIISTQPMIYCDLNYGTPRGDFFVEVFCKGEKDDYSVSYADFGIVNGQNHQVSFDLINQTDINGNSFDSSYDLSSLYSNNDCNDNELKGELESVILQVNVPYFNGSFYYDPEISVLLSNNDNGNNCNDSTFIENRVIWILSLSFSCCCFIFILFIICLSEHKYFRKYFFGKEGSRIRTLRKVKPKKPETVL